MERLSSVWVGLPIQTDGLMVACATRSSCVRAPPQGGARDGGSAVGGGVTLEDQGGLIGGGAAAVAAVEAPAGAAAQDGASVRDRPARSVNEAGVPSPPSCQEIHPVARDDAQLRLRGEPPCATVRHSDPTDLQSDQDLLRCRRPSARRC